MKKKQSLLILSLTALCTLGSMSACNGKKKTSNTSSSASPVSETVSSDTTSSKHAHNYGEWVVTKKATCTEDGSEKRTCACGETETRSITALGHSFNEITGKCDRDGCTLDYSKEQSPSSVGVGETIELDVVNGKAYYHFKTMCITNYSVQEADLYDTDDEAKANQVISDIEIYEGEDKKDITEDIGISCNTFSNSEGKYNWRYNTTKSLETDTEYYVVLTLDTTETKFSVFSNCIFNHSEDTADAWTLEDTYRTKHACEYCGGDMTNTVKEYYITDAELKALKLTDSEIAQAMTVAQLKALCESKSNEKLTVTYDHSYYNAGNTNYVSLAADASLPCGTRVATRILITPKEGYCFDTSASTSVCYPSILFYKSITAYEAGIEFGNSVPGTHSTEEGEEKCSLCNNSIATYLTTNASNHTLTSATLNPGINYFKAVLKSTDGSVWLTIEYLDSEALAKSTTVFIYDSSDNSLRLSGEGTTVIDAANNKVSFKFSHVTDTILIKVTYGGSEATTVNLKVANAY